MNGYTGFKDPKKLIDNTKEVEKIIQEEVATFMDICISCGKEREGEWVGDYENPYFLCKKCLLQHQHDDIHIGENEILPEEEQ